MKIAAILNSPVMDKLIQYEYVLSTDYRANSFGGDSHLIFRSEKEGTNRLSISITQDRLQLFMECKHASNNTWFSIGLIRCLITSEAEFHDIMDKQNIQFVAANFENILQLFTEDKAAETIKKLRQLMAIRSKQLFG